MATITLTNPQNPIASKNPQRRKKRYNTGGHLELIYAADCGLGEGRRKRWGFRQRGWSMQISNKFPCFIPRIITLQLPRLEILFRFHLCVLLLEQREDSMGTGSPVPRNSRGRRSKLCYKSTSSSFVQDLLIVLSPFVKLH